MQGIVYVEEEGQGARVWPRLRIEEGHGQGGIGWRGETEWRPHPGREGMV